MKSRHSEKQSQVVVDGHEGHRGAPSGSPAVRRMFSDIAGRYDLLNRLLSLGIDVRWRRDLVREVPAAGDLPVLDLATGTADVAIALRRALPANRPIVGADFSLPMLERGAEKIRRGGHGRVALCAADALALPFHGGSFSSVTIAFGLRNLPHRMEALGEFFRVLAPGGRLAVLEFSSRQGRLAGPLYRAYFHHILPMVGGIISGNREAYRYLPRSVGEFPVPQALAGEMRAAGFTEVRFRPLTFGIAYLHVGVRSTDS